MTESFTLDDETITVARAFRYRTRGARITECWLYDHQQHLVDLAWAQAPESP